MEQLKLEIESAFYNMDRELKFHYCPAGLHKTIVMAAYMKDFYCIALELGDEVPNNAALLFIYVKVLKSEVQILQHPDQVVEAD